MSRRTISVLISLVVFVAFAARASAQPSVPGFNVSIFAELPSPTLMDFAPNGELYVGHGDASGRIRRISPDGLTIVDFGPLIEDPDAVLVDVNGTYSGTPLSVLVGGGAFIYAIAPDETMTTLYSGSPTFRNVGEMSFDSLSRLLFVDLGQLATPQVAVSDGGAFPVNLFNLPLVPFNLAIATDDSIYTCGNYGTIKIHAPDGTPINESFVTNLGGRVILEFGPGGAWGTLLHFIDRSGILMTVDSSGNTTVLGSAARPRPTRE